MQLKTELSINIDDITQRQLAIDPQQSFIVQAPAGSGKTELLIQRMLMLLNHVEAPEEILAITFTKKAANEMRTRVMHALKAAAQEPLPLSEHARQTWYLAKKVLARDEQFQWHLLNNPNQLRIQTIDSLCAFLTKQLPLLSHFGSQPDISDQPYSLYEEAVLDVLHHMEEKLPWSEAITKLLLHLDNDLNKLHNLLVNLLAKRDQWLPYILFNSSDTDIKSKLEKYLTHVIIDTLSIIKNLFPLEYQQELCDLARFAANNVTENSPISSCKDLIKFPDAIIENKNIWNGIAKLLLTEDLEWRKTVDKKIGFPAPSSVTNKNEKETFSTFKKRMISLIEKLNLNEELKQALSEILFLPEASYTEQQWEILQCLLTVLKVAAAQLRVVFQQHTKIDFIENSQAALLALGNEEQPTDLALALDYQIKHILIDEFQDTSLSQYQLLEKLILGWQPNDGRTLFVVGDPMQSIYRFREAEVGLFIRMRRFGIGNLKLIPIALTTNFRSYSNIVNWNNKHFTQIFPKFDNIVTGAVSFSQSFAYHSEQQEAVYIKGLINASDNDQAKDIIKQLSQTLHTFPEDSIAILVRSRSHLSAIIPELKKHQIAYQAVDIDSLVDKQVIQDLFALTRALLHLADRLAWLSILRAPWCGLCLADLLVLAKDKNKNIYQMLMEANKYSEISEDGFKRLNRIIPIIKAKTAARERYSLRTLIEKTWQELGGPACISDPSDIEAAEAYFNLLEQFNTNELSLSLDKLRNQISQLYAPIQPGNAKVYIMTIHSAKGLEFDTVILPHLEGKLRTDDKSLLLWMERPLSNEQTSLLLAPIHATGTEKDTIYEYISRQLRAKIAYESDRLLYVATTRAKKRLFLYFNTTFKDNNEIRSESGSFLEKLKPFIKPNELVNTDNTQAEEKSTQRALRRLTTEWTNPFVATENLVLAYHTKSDGFALNSLSAPIMGTVIHRLLQQISLFGIEWWQTQTDITQNLYLKKMLSERGMTKANLNSATDKTKTIIQQALQDKRGQWILTSHKDDQSELSLTCVINGSVETLVIDRTFVDENNIRWIIDYKTTAFNHTDLELFIKQEQQKYVEKMLKYTQAIKNIDSRPIKLGLYFPAIPAWHEWE